HRLTVQYPASPRAAPRLQPPASPAGARGRPPPVQPSGAIAETRKLYHYKEEGGTWRGRAGPGGPPRRGAGAGWRGSRITNAQSNEFLKWVCCIIPSCTPP